MPLSLHVNWYDRTLFVWGETEPRAARTAAAAVDAGAAPHPFAAGVDELRAALGELSPDTLLATIAPQSPLILELPADETRPVGSPFLPGAAPAVEPVAAEPVAPILRRFYIPALTFSPAQAIDLLASLPSELPASCADSVRYWTVLARFLISLIGRRQFIPQMTPQPGDDDDVETSYTASWQVVVQDRVELRWLEQLAHAMPPVCRAVVGGSEPPQALTNGADETDPFRLVESFLNETADALIRRTVADDPFFRDAVQRGVVHGAPMEMRWLTALLSNDRHVPGASADNAVLASLVESWVGRLEQVHPIAGMRVCFALVEPAKEPPPSDTADTAPPPSSTAALWRLELRLELPGSDQSIPAEDLWRQGGSGAAILGRSLKQRRSHFMAEIARAAELYPSLGVLRTVTAPCGLWLTTTDAHAFIRQWAPVLRESGFGVTLPDWAARAGGELGLRLVLRPVEPLPGGPISFFAFPGARPPEPHSTHAGMELSSGQFAMDSLLQFDWQIAVGDLRLTPEEFRHLAQQNAPLVQYRGRWIQIDNAVAETTVQFIEKNQGQQMTLAQALRTAYSLAETQTGLPVLGLDGTSWIEHLLNQTPGAALESLPQPASFDGQLRAYQLRGLQWLAFLDRIGIGACLADDMGLGKTIQLIALLLHERNGPPAPDGAPRPRVGPTLLFAPTSVVGNWVREIQRFAKSLRVLVHHGPQRLSGQRFIDEARQADVVISSYALANRDREELQAINWHRLALDEAQKIKNPAAASTISIRNLQALHRVALTGTPIENHLSELWSIMEILNPGLLGSASEFRERFAVPVEKLGDKARAEQLRQMIRPFVLRRLKSDPEIAGDLPEKMEMRVFCNLTPEQASIYERLVADALGHIDSATGIRRRGLILSVLTRLKQVCDHPSLVLKDTAQHDARSGKCERLIEMLEEVVDEGDAALVFTQFREMGHVLEKMIAQRLRTPVLFLHGGTPAKQRDEMIENFQAGANGVKVFILSLRAGGLGLNLTAANHVFHFDRWWNPAVEAQATDRAHRVGQTRNVQVHKFVCIGTMEERIDRLLTEKLALADKIIGSGDEWLTGLSTEQLREYLTLSQDAVRELD